MLSTFEKKYLASGFIMLCVSPIQVWWFYQIFLNQNFDVIAIQPTLALIMWAVPAAFVQTASLWLLLGREDAGYCVSCHCITAFPVFAFHYAVLALFRMAVITSIRAISGNKEFRRDDPHLIWDYGLDLMD